ncbi:hypothetical protein [Moritella viscosa]|uniref:TMhelix containing protein n=1 Tax=Moritella viscosa TaxID=80854 RepID=A0ABY1HHL6_9GAMM|nr:hypothetical protein [Moritella viscosa]SGY93993.1 Putative uncharacterized protein [Moritella viscosa]SGZ05465.1 Putative uncharacterized protein [Moritella viscosa]SGZ07696.1 Putative uncharacterized protein [Moritella viscosa]SHO26766.1 Putative uncharacterized protein [Moritella viscosa]
MWTLLTALVTGGFSAFNAVRKNKADEIKQDGVLKAAISEAKAKRAAAGDTNAAKLDEISMNGRGWKDEYLLLITTAPLILCFLPDYSQFVGLGFELLETVPEYYWYGLGMVYIDTFGFRRMLRTAMEQWVNKRAVL